MARSHRGHPASLGHPSYHSFTQDYGGVTLRIEKFTQYIPDAF
jgi:hypothetical protein